MARPRAAKKTEEHSSGLIEALKFVSLAQRESGETYQTHVILSDKTAVTFDGTLAAGVYIEEDLTACPHTALLIGALSKAKETISIGQTSDKTLTIKTGLLKAHVPCVARSSMQTIQPDAPIAPINNQFIACLSKIAHLATEHGSHVITSSILIRRYSMVATDRHIMFECWHGIDMPTFGLPKAAAIALIKCGKELQWFGFSQNSITFYFSDNSWLRSQLYTDKWPDVDSILNVQSNAWPIPPNFYDGVRAVLNFNDSGYVKFKKNELASHDEEGIGASYQVSGVPAGPVFAGKYLLLLEPQVRKIDFVASEGKAVFFGENFRGVLTGISKPHVPKMTYVEGVGEVDEDIPF